MSNKKVKDNKESKLVEVYIRLKKAEEKVKSSVKRPKQMHLGNVLVTSEYQKLKVDVSLLDSVQCEHWMDVSEDEPEELVAARKKDVAKKAKKAKGKK